MHTYQKVSKVFWKWGKERIRETIEEVYLEPIEKEIKHTTVKRNASKENPAYLIKEKDKDAYVLKLHSQLN